MPRFFAKKLTVDELDELIMEAEDTSNSYCVKELTPVVAKDLSKVEFDTENIDPATGSRGGGIHSVGGMNTLPNGLSYKGILAGGDWEWPLFFIIYYDGKKLHGYIPKEGNLWNTDTEEAYGNDASDLYNGTTPKDIANAKKRGFIVQSSTCEMIDDAQPQRDWGKIIADIEKRIVFKP